MPPRHACDLAYVMVMRGKTPADQSLTDEMLELPFGVHPLATPKAKRERAQAFADAKLWG